MAAQTVSEIMTTGPVTLASTATVAEAAKQMRGHDVGDVIVTHTGEICGIVTDRDIVVRVIADGKDPQRTELSSVCSGEVTTIEPQRPLEDAIGLMRDKAVRRLPVVDGGKAVGVVSIGDAAIERDPRSALADISAAPSNV